VLVAMQDGRAAPKIIDFGVAKAVGQRLTEHTLMTAFAQIVGTPLYMSPEQAELSPMGVDTRSDIYSLGVLLYELLTNTTPFDKDRLHASSYDEMRRIIREEEPPTPSARIGTLAANLATTLADRHRTDPRRLRQSVRGELDWIVMKCLEKDRNRRYESATALAEDVQRYMNGKPVLACPPSSVYQFRKFVARNRISVFAVSTVVIALVLGLALASIGLIKARRQRFVAEENAARADRAARTTAAVSESLQQMLRSADPISGKGREYTVHQLLEDYAKNLPGKLLGLPEAEAELQTTIGLAYRRLGEKYKAHQHLARAVELQRQTFGDDHDKVADSLVNFAWALREQDRYEEAEAQLQAAVTIFRRRHVYDARFVYALRSLQANHASLEKWDKVESVGYEAFDVARRSGNIHLPEVIPVYIRLAEVLEKKSKHAEAVDLLRTGLAAAEQVLGPEHIETAAIRSALGNALLTQGEFDEALACHQRVLACFAQVYPPEHWRISYAAEYIIATLRAAERASALVQSMPSPTTLTDIEMSLRQLLTIAPVPYEPREQCILPYAVAKLPYIYRGLSRELLANGRNAEAEAMNQKGTALVDFLQTMANESDDARKYVAIIVALVDLNRNDEAHEIARKLLDQKKDPASMLQSYTTYLKNSDPALAASLAEEFLGITEPEPETHRAPPIDESTKGNKSSTTPPPTTNY
jgi:tetratricopeptide (TPR) repeat protein